MVAALSGCSARDGGAPETHTSADDAGVDAATNDLGNATHDLGLVAFDATPPDLAAALPEICNGVDDDLDGRVDNVDVASDGICDCLQIGIVGVPGSRPSSDFPAWLEARGTGVVRLPVDTEITEATLASFDVIVVDNLVRDYAPSEADALSAFATGGGGVIAMTGYVGGATSETRVNSLLEKVGVHFVQGELISPREGEIVLTTTHATMLGVSALRFIGGRYVALNETAPFDFEAETVATYHDQAIGIAARVGGGHVVAWGDEWISYDDLWRDTTLGTEMFWVNAIGWTRPQDICELIF